MQGDEIRRLDWKVFGKTDRYYVREYEEETNLRATLLLDLSGSMRYAGAGGVALLVFTICRSHSHSGRLAVSLPCRLLRASSTR